MTKILNSSVEDILQFLLEETLSAEKDTIKKFEDNVVDFLSSEDDVIISNTKQLVLLLLAKVIFAALPNSLVNYIQNMYYKHNFFFM